MKYRQAEGIPTKLAGDGKFDSRGKLPTGVRVLFSKELG